MDERRNGTRRLYRARPEGMAELRAFLEEFWDTRLDALKREAEREERKKDGNDTTTEAPVYERELQIAAVAGDGVGVPRRPGEGGPLEGPARDGFDAASRRRVPDRDHPRARRERRVRGARAAAPARLHLGLGAGRRRAERRAARLLDGRDRAGAGRTAARSCGSPIATCRASRPRSRTRRAGITTSTGSRPRRRAATPAATRGSESLPDRAPAWRT